MQKKERLFKMLHLNNTETAGKPCEAGDGEGDHAEHEGHGLSFCIAHGTVAGDTGIFGSQAGVCLLCVHCESVYSVGGQMAIRWSGTDINGGVVNHKSVGFGQKWHVCSVLIVASVPSDSTSRGRNTLVQSESVGVCIGRASSEDIDSGWRGR